MGRLESRPAVRLVLAQRVMTVSGAREAAAKEWDASRRNSRRQSRFARSLRNPTSARSKRSVRSLINPLRVQGPRRWRSPSMHVKDRNPDSLSISFSSDSRSALFC